MPKIHTIPNLSELKQADRVRLGKALKENGGKAKLVVHYGFCWGTTADKNYLDHLKKLKDYMENGDKPIFYMLPHPKLEEFKINHEYQNDTLEALETKAPIITIHTCAQTPTPVFENWFQGIIWQNQDSNPTELGPVYDIHHADRSWKRLDDFFEDIGVTELELVGEQAGYKDPDKIKISTLRPEEISSALGVWNQNSDNRVLLRGCLAKAHQMLLKHAKNLKLVVREDLIFPGKTTP